MLLKQVTDDTWEILDKDQSCGSVKTVPGGYLVSTGVRVEVIPSLKDLVKEHHMVVVEKSGLPIKHADYTLVPNTTPPMYRRSARSEYAAGYWAIKNNTRWAIRYCPSVKTLQASYDVMGPYSSREELKTALRSRPCM